MTKQRIRCAIYTRKSTEEGLDQDFNSLDAQREACEASVASQRHEGWVVDKTQYSDGGVSGGTLDRPAMQRLLCDIDAGRIQMVVVYKIDRLTRSLADFAKLVERFDGAGCSFVSVTQAFNTASSMGRLTLNVLLSFAQFEREVTAERIRDKIAASKKKGLWMGGMPPLGYDPHPDPKVRGLVMNADEARTVKKVFALYQELGCLNGAMREANALGLRSKRHHFKSGRRQGGNPLSRGQIYAILRNPIYAGKIRHKHQVWPGLHEPIVEEPQWEKTQELLQKASARPRSRRVQSAQATIAAAELTGKLVDETGDRLTPTHTKRHGKRFTYYVSNRLISGGVDPTGWRLPSARLETALRSIIAKHLMKLGSRHELVVASDISAASSIAERVEHLATRLEGGTSALLGRLLQSGQLSKGSIALCLDADILTIELGLQSRDLNPAVLNITAPFALRRRGVEVKLIAGDRQPEPDPTLIRALGLAHRAAAALQNGTPLVQICAAEGCSDAYIRTRTQLAFLAPKIQVAILEGLQPAELTLERLVRNPIPLNWDEQIRAFGFLAR